MSGIPKQKNFFRRDSHIISLTIPMFPFFDKFEEIIKNRVLEQNLILELYPEKIVVTGPKDNAYQLQNDILLAFCNHLALETPQHKMKKQTIPNITLFRNIIKRKAESLSLRYVFSDHNIVIEGLESNVNELEQFVGGLKEAQKFIETKMKDEDFIQTSLEIHEIFSLNLSGSDEIEENAKKYNVEIERSNNNKSLIVYGSLLNSYEFMKWLYSHTFFMLENLKLEQEEMQALNVRQEEIIISAFHRKNKREILEKADELGIARDFGRDVLLATGNVDNIRELKAYLYDLEVTGLKSLYPKYWDFHDPSHFVEIQVQPDSEEFQMVLTEFNKTMNNFVITKLTRIQNKYLMDHYVSTLQKRQELRPDVELNRRLLFHGTKEIDPKIIYKDSDTGFDIQYSNPRGSCGKGIYFAINANYSNGYAFKSNGTSQIFLADVFIGNPYKGQINSNFIKAPEGHDSVEHPSSFFVVYNNFHSYPLYLIDYKNR